jgi:hypothetical protein
LSILDDGTLATELTDALTQWDIPIACVLQRDEVTGPVFDPEIVTVNYGVQGWRDVYSAAERLDGAVLQSDTKIYIVANGSSVEPRATDRITIAGSTFNVIRAELDAANACWVCQCRA